MTLTPGQCKAARRLLDCSLDSLAHKVRLSEIDIARFEAGKPGMSSIGVAMIRRALELSGVAFLDGPPWARLRDDRCSPAQVKAGREAIGLSHKALAVIVQVGEARIADFEAGRRDLPREVMESVKGALEAAGVEFVRGEPGVRLKTPK
jgi:predicted transcriptional regulator